MFVALATVSGAWSQEKGDNVVTVGIGFGGNLYSGSGYTGKMPPVSLTYERFILGRLWDDKSSLGIGGYLGYTSAKYSYVSGLGWKYSDVILGVRGAVHYRFVDRLDTYSGLLLGYDIVSSKATGNWGSNINYSPNASAVAWSWFAGGRYYFSDVFAAYAEIGYGIAWFNVGAALKF
jgi:hypothetical protein